MGIPPLDPDDELVILEAAHLLCQMLFCQLQQLISVAVCLKDTTAAILINVRSVFPEEEVGASNPATKLSAIATLCQGNGHQRLVFEEVELFLHFLSGVITDSLVNEVGRFSFTSENDSVSQGLEKGFNLFQIVVVFEFSAGEDA